MKVIHWDILPDYLRETKNEVLDACSQYMEHKTLKELGECIDFAVRFLSKGEARNAILYLEDAYNEVAKQRLKIGAEIIWKICVCLMVAQRFANDEE